MNRRTVLRFCLLDQGEPGYYCLPISQQIDQEGVMAEPTTILGLKLEAQVPYSRVSYEAF
jgi:hypothetical protein